MFERARALQNPNYRHLRRLFTAFAVSAGLFATNNDAATAENNSRVHNGTIAGAVASGYRVAGPYFNELASYPPVKPGEFKESSVYGQAASLKSQIEKSTPEYCATGSPFPVLGMGMYIYTKVKGEYREIEAFYNPGDAHLHSTVDYLPSGATFDREYIAYFNGKPYDVPVTFYPGGMQGDEYNDLAFKIPEEVGHPAYVGRPDCTP